GLVPGEYSSGNSIRPRGITKVGNSELRRLLYEAAWSYRTPAKVGAWLIYYRPDSVTQYSKDIAWKAQQQQNLIILVRKKNKELVTKNIKMKETYFFILNSSSVSQVFASVFMMTISGSGMN
ncbi:transposase, partial [Escherichia coli]